MAHIWTACSNSTQFSLTATEPRHSATQEADSDHSVTLVAAVFVCLCVYASLQVRERVYCAVGLQTTKPSPDK